MARPWTALLLSAALCAQAPPWFEDVSARSGVDFVLNHSPTPDKHQIETMAGGVAAFDYDNDGLLDLFFANGAEQPGLAKTSPRFHNRLFRNLGGWRFEDVTAKAGLAGEGYSMGVAAGDYDNDGFVDLFVAGVRRSFLFRNRGDGTFLDVSAKAGVRGGEWSIAAAWVDYNRDGHLDLFVVNYVKWDPAAEPFCGDPARAYRTYCHPKFYEGLPNILYRNDGGGVFTDVSRETGVAAHAGKGMGIALGDFDSDGWPDVFVANDTVPNFLFHNQRGAGFRETALAAGVAYNDDGRALSSMGVDFRDVDDDSRDDLFVTALANETYPLYRNLGKGLFADITYPSRIGAATLPFSGWGTGAYDFDNDGHKDLFAANGDVQDNTEVYSSRKSRQPNLLLIHRGDKIFQPLPVGAPALYRGAAFGDFDNDGRVDVVLTRLGERAVIYRNVAGPANHWLALRLRGSKSNRDGIGARVKLVTAGGAERFNHATTSVGYASSSEKAVHFGLGREDRAKTIEIAWPSGAVQKFEDVPTGRYLEVAEP